MEPENIPIKPVILDSLRILVPLYLTCIVFVSSVFFIFIPHQKQQIINHKKQTILELTASVESMLVEYDARVQQKEFPLEKAQKEAMRVLRSIKYGTNGNRYFWISDMSGRIIMHPVMPELEGKITKQPGKAELNNFTIAFQEIIQQIQQGSITSGWIEQKNDSVPVPKLSFIKKFMPWGWVIGTGILTHEIDLEIQSITKEFIRIFKGILIFLVVLSIYITWQVISITRKRIKSEQIKASEGAGVKKLLQLVQMDLKTKDSVVRFALKGLIDLTRSNMGYITLIDGKKRKTAVYTLSDPGREPEHQEIESSRDELEIWAKPILDQHGIILNQCLNRPPFPPVSWAGQGQEIARFMGIPVFHRDRIAVLAGVADKKQPYSSQDFRQLKLMGQGMWKFLETIKSREKLEKNEQKYRLLAENITDVIGIAQVSTLKFSFISQSVEQLIGYTPEEFMQLPLESTITDSSLTNLRRSIRNKHKLAFTSRFHQNRSHLSLDLELIHKNGSVLWVEAAIRFLVNEKNEPDRIMGIVRNISQRKALEEELRKSNNDLRLAQKIAKIGFWAIDPISGTSKCSEEFYNIHEKDPNEKPRLLHEHMQVYSYQDQKKLETAIQKALDQGTPFSFETLLTLPSKNEKWIHIICDPQLRPDSKGYYLSGITQDISERKNMEITIQQGQKMEAMGTLAGGIAHDFNNILSSIMGFTELARLEANDHPKIMEILDRVLAGGLRARDLVRQILTFSRKADVRERPVQPAILIKETIKFLRASTPKDIEIKSRIDDPSCTILADPTHIHQVLLNLFTNAVHAMKKQGGVLEVGLNVVELGHEKALDGEIAPGRYVQMVVSDTGCGIPRHLIDKIFDPFFTTKKRGEGTGLGLSTAYGIVNSIGGKILVHTQPEKGTRFKILIPEYTKKAEDDPEENSLPVRMGNSHILIVDDEADILDWTSQMLSAYGYQIQTASSGAAALERINQSPKPFDLVLTDLSMPKMNGLLLARKIKELRPGLPILLCTGMLEETPEEVMANGVISGIIMKPLIAGELFNFIEAAVKQTDKKPD